MTAAYRAEGAEVLNIERPRRRSRAAVTKCGGEGVTPRVLIVDDISENRQMLALLCERFGFHWEAVEGGQEAIKAAQVGGFDLILMDIFMPRVDGMEATRAIRALRSPAADLPIIAVTTAAEPGDKLRYLACGMTDMVAKPIVPANLFDTMTAALARSEAAPARRTRTA